MILISQGLPEEIADVKDLHPWNPAVYGTLVFLLLISTILFYRNWVKSEEYNKTRDAKVLDFNRQIIELMVKIEIRLNDQQKLSTDIGDIKHTVDTLIRSLDELKQEL